MPKHLIVAGNYHQALNHARENGYAPNSWAFVDRTERMRGLTNAVVEFVGTWKSLPASFLKEILAETQILKAKFYERVSSQGVPL